MLRTETVSKFQDYINNAVGKNGNPLLFARNTTFSQQQIDIARQLITDLNGQELSKNIHKHMSNALARSINAAHIFTATKNCVVTITGYDTQDIDTLLSANPVESLNIIPVATYTLKLNKGDNLFEHACLSEVQSEVFDRVGIKGEKVSVEDITRNTSQNLRLVPTLGVMLIGELVEMKISQDVELQSMIPTSNP